MKHLWEVDHPYMMNMGNYFDADCHERAQSLDQFLQQFDEADIDYNWVIRWDWIEGRGCDDDFVRPADRPDTYMDGTLLIQFVGQRKSILFTWEIPVCRYDEPRVRAFLAKYAGYMAKMWAPFDLTAPAEDPL